MARTRSTASPKKRTMSAEHKTAIATARRENKAVGEYLTALREHAPRRGRRRTVESIDRRLAEIAQQLDQADALSALKLLQQRADLTAERAAVEYTADPEQYLDAFVEHAARYAQRNGIAYSTWREAGVPAAVLKQAGITRQ